MGKLGEVDNRSVNLTAQSDLSKVDKQSTNDRQLNIPRDNQPTLANLTLTLCDILETDSGLELETEPISNAQTERVEHTL